MRTDLRLQPISQVPYVGGLYGSRGPYQSGNPNDVFVDPDFGLTMVRCTDASCGKGNNLSLQTTDDTSAYSVWNSNDTALVLRDTNSNGYVFQFTPSTLQCRQITGKTSVLTAGSTGPIITGNYCWSRVTPGLLYSIASNSTKVMANVYTLVNGVYEFQSQTVYCDFQNILPAGFTPKWVGTFAISENDSVFGTAFSSTGGQGTGIYVCLFNGTTYRMLNTNTLAINEVGPSWGTTGTATGTGVSGGAFKLHDVSQTPNPSYINLTNTTQDVTLVWNLPTLNITNDTQAGHHALGYLHGFNGSPGGGQFSSSLYSNPTVATNIIPKQVGPPGLPSQQSPVQTYAGDMHSGFGLIDANDHSLMWISNGPAGTTFQNGSFTSCWQNEIRGLDVTGYITNPSNPAAGIGTVYRACHTFNSNISPTFDVQNAFCSPSNSGNFVAFCSDFGGTNNLIGPLGSTAGGATGAIGGNARGDVFIVQVGGAVPTPPVPPNPPTPPAPPTPASGAPFPGMIPISGGNYQGPDGKPLAFGKVTFKLNTDAKAGTYQVTAGRVVTFNLDANGNLAGYIWPNDGMTPNDTVYIAKAYNAAGQWCWEAQFYITTPSWVYEEVFN